MLEPCLLIPVCQILVTPLPNYQPPLKCVKQCDEMSKKPLAVRIALTHGKCKQEILSSFSIGRNPNIRKC